MDPLISDLILTEIQSMRKEMNDGFSETKQRIAIIETHTSPFFETDGGLQQIHENLEELKRAKWVFLGGAGVLSGLIHAVTKKLGI